LYPTPGAVAFAQMPGSDVEGGSPAALILAVDDVPANLLALSGILEPLCHEIVTATSGPQALELAARDTFAVILLDVMMPGMDGFATLARLRAMTNAQQTPVILLTAYELNPHAMDQLQGMGLVDYILKPIPPELLRSKVAALAGLYLRGEELRRRDEAMAAKDRGIAILAHDLQNPLAAVAIAAGRLLRRDLEPGAHETAQRISRGVARMSHMIRDLTDYARAGRGPLPIAPGPMAIGELCRELVDEFQQVEPTRRIHLACAGDLAGDWDRMRLYQAVSNLVRNALHYGSGDVAIRAADREGFVEITVHNAGAPIPPESLPVIFDAFERGTQEGAGLGLGLHIVREIAKAHGGEVLVTSSAGEGTTFALRLPRRR
jgi:signal transduction histidine kinase